MDKYVIPSDNLSCCFMSAAEIHSVWRQSVNLGGACDSGSDARCKCYGCIVSDLQREYRFCRKSNVSSESYVCPNNPVSMHDTVAGKL